MFILEMRSDQGHSDTKMGMQHSITPRCIHTPKRFGALRQFKGLIWPPLGPKLKAVFHQFLLIGILEE